jgi:hypothetical protein
MIAAPSLTFQAPRLAPKRRSAVSSVAPAYASASSHTHFCVIPNANAYGFSRPVGVACSEGDC